MYRAGDYIGPITALRGHRALLLDRNAGDSIPDDARGPRHCPRGFLFAQFTSVSEEMGDPDCLKSGGPTPKDDDLRFGWHMFKKRDFKIEVIDGDR